jgi:hypothetical protein
MKRVYSSPDSAQVELIRSMLESKNIRCEVRNEIVSQVMVGVQFAPELWVRDEDYDEAVRLVRGTGPE